MAMRMSKKVITIGAGCLAATGLLLGSVEYATHMYTANNVAAVNAPAAVMETVSEQVGTKSTGKKKNMGVTKEETVYVTMDASGTPEEVLVSNWLKNSGINGTLKDKSNLTDIQNTKGEEEFTQDGSSLLWETGAEDIYYQGKSSEEIPCQMSITYKLDGEEISPEELAGKSGKLEMTIQYTNLSKQTVKIKGIEKEIYTPFIMATGMILPVENFKNVQVDNGHVVSEGDNDLVMVYGMPGLKENLDLDTLDFGEDMDMDTDKLNDKMTDTAVLTADVTDFQMKATYTVATSSLFDDVDFDDVSDTDELSNKMDDLQDATNDLVDGSDKIQKNLKKLDKNFTTYAKAIRKLKDSVKTLDKGATDINDATAAYTKGADKLLAGVKTYVDGTKTFAKSTKTYSGGAKTLVDGVGQLYQGAQSFPSSYEEFHGKLSEYTTGVDTLLSEDNMTSLTGASKKLKEGVKTVDEGLKAAQAGVKQMNDGAKQLNDQKSGADEMIKQYKALAEQYQQIAQSGAASEQEKAQAAQLATLYSQTAAYLTGAETLAESVYNATDGQGEGDLAAGLAKLEAATNTESKEENLYTGLSALDTSADAIAANAGKLRQAKTPLMEASAKIKGSVETIVGKLKEIHEGGATLTGNNEELNKAADTLTKNAGTINKNAKKLTAKSKSFRKGANVLEKGTGKLFDGVLTLYDRTGDVSDGINKLADGSYDLYDGMKEFREEGTDKLSDTVDEAVDGLETLQDRAEATFDAAKAYKSFSGIVGNMDGSVKFIMTTKEIKAEEEE